MGTDGDGIEVVRGWVGMEVKVDGDGWGLKQSLWGRVGMGVISVPVQVSSVLYTLTVRICSSLNVSTRVFCIRETHNTQLKLTAQSGVCTLVQ